MVVRLFGTSLLRCKGSAGTILSFCLAQFAIGFGCWFFWERLGADIGFGFLLFVTARVCAGCARVALGAAGAVNFRH